MSFRETADDRAWPRGADKALGGHVGHAGHNSQGVDDSQERESLRGWAGLQPGKARHQKEVETPQRPSGVLIKAINGVDRMTSKQRLGKLSRSGLLGKPL